MALQARGIRIIEALTAGIALHAIEMIVGLGLGTAGSLSRARTRAGGATPRGRGCVVALRTALGATTVVAVL
jgi:hypothetical protein